MNYSKYRFNLDMQSYISQISLPVRQHDTGIVLRINLTDGGVPYVIRDGCRAVFYARKSDGNPLMNDCIIEKNTTICYELTQQTTSCSGVVDCEVRLYGADGNLITTPRFILVVDSRVVHDEDFPLSEEEQTVLDNIILSETERQQNETDRQQTYNQMVETVEKASLVATTLEQKLATGDYNGITPHIGADGKWKLGDKDTGVIAAGATHVAKGRFETVKVATPVADDIEYHQFVSISENGTPNSRVVTGDKIELRTAATITFDFKPKIIFFGNSHATYYIWGESVFYGAFQKDSQTHKIFAQTSENDDGTYSLTLYSEPEYVGGNASTTPPIIDDLLFLYSDIEEYYGRGKYYPTLYADNLYIAIGRGNNTIVETLPEWQGGEY